MDKSCKKNLLLHQIGQRFTPTEIRELKTVGDICTLRLRTGQLLMASLDRSGSLRLEELDEVC